jgi:hypothetical protein
MKAKCILPLLLLAGFLPSSDLHAQIFESNIYTNSSTIPQSIGEYNLNGTPVESGTLVSSGLDDPRSIALSGSDIFVSNLDNNTIGEYTTAGAPVGSGTLISSGLDNPLGIAVSGSDIFVVNNYGGTPGEGSIGEYTTSGTIVNASLVSGLNIPSGIAVSGSDIFVSIGGGNGSGDNASINEYTTAGMPVGTGTLVSSGLAGPAGIAVSGSDILSRIMAAQTPVRDISANTPLRD